MVKTSDVKVNQMQINAIKVFHRVEINQVFSRRYAIVD